MRNLLRSPKMRPIWIVVYLYWLRQCAIEGGNGLLAYRVMLFDRDENTSRLLGEANFSLLFAYIMGTCAIAGLLSIFWTRWGMLSRGPRLRRAAAYALVFSLVAWPVSAHFLGAQVASLTNRPTVVEYPSFLPDR